MSSEFTRNRCVIFYGKLESIQKLALALLCRISSFYRVCFTEELLTHVNSNPQLQRPDTLCAHTELQWRKLMHFNLTHFLDICQYVLPLVTNSAWPWLPIHTKHWPPPCVFAATTWPRKHGFLFPPYGSVARCPTSKCDPSPECSSVREQGFYTGRIPRRFPSPFLCFIHNLPVNNEQFFNIIMFNLTEGSFVFAVYMLI